MTIETEVEVGNTTSLTARIVALEDRLAAQNKRLIEQEHRPLALIRDIRDWKWGSDECWAAVGALFVRLFVASPAIAATAGSVAVAGVFLAYQANQKLEVQNELIGTQNEFFQAQIQQQALQEYHARRAQLLATLYDTRECWPGEEPRKARTSCISSSIEARTAAALSLVQIESEVRAEPDRWPGVTVNLTTQLSGVNLRNGQLSYEDLSMVSFGPADLRGATLVETNLSGAFLDGADLRDAWLAGASLRGATLRRAELRDALLAGADFRDADLQSANLSGANIEDAYFSGAFLPRADLRGANLSKADLSGANLSSADLNGANLSGANLTGANLRGADISGANLEEADLTDVALSGDLVCPSPPLCFAN